MDVTDVAHGTHHLTVRVRIHEDIAESDYANNVSTVEVTLKNGQVSGSTIP